MLTEARTNKSREQCFRLFEATIGFEPMNNAFAERPLKPLGYVAGGIIKIAKFSGEYKGYVLIHASVRIIVNEQDALNNYSLF